jgi:phosphoribosylformylglycinamidine synthase
MAEIYYLNLSQDAFKLGGSSFNQTQNKIGNETPTIKNIFSKSIQYLQDLIERKIKAGHDIGSGGLITTLLEMCFADVNLGANFDLTSINEIDSTKLLFSENIAVVFQADAEVEATFKSQWVEIFNIGTVTNSDTISIVNHEDSFEFSSKKNIEKFGLKHLLIRSETNQNGKSLERYENFANQPLQFTFPLHFDGILTPALSKGDGDRQKRQLFVNSEREMANAMYLLVLMLDVHMTDLISGRETWKTFSSLELLEVSLTLMFWALPRVGWSI